MFRVIPGSRVLIFFAVLSTMLALSKPVWGELTLQHHEENSGLYSVFFLDSDYGWACGGPDLQLRTTNGGESWEKSVFPDKEGLIFTNISFLSRDGGYCLKRDEKFSLVYYSLFTTRDGGVNWERIPDVSDSVLTYSFCNEKTGWVACQNYEGEWWLLKTIDGGDSWEEMKRVNKIYQMNQLKFLDILCVDENTCYILHGNDTGLVWYAHTYLDVTKDGGKSWETIYYLRSVSYHFASRLEPSSIKDIIWLFKKPPDVYPVPFRGYSLFNVTSRRIDFTVEDLTVLAVLEIASYGNGEALFYVANHPGHDSQDGFMYTYDNAVTFENFQNFPQLYPDYPKEFWYEITGISAPVKDEVWITTTNGDIFKYTLDPVAVDESADQPHPSLITLYPPTPNPFNPSTVIRFTLAERSDVELYVYNLAGQKVATLIDGLSLNAGSHKVIFDGSGLASGVYLCVCRAGKAIKTVTMVLVK